MNDVFFSLWELFLSSLAPLIGLALGVSMIGWLFMKCRVPLRVRIKASVIIFSLLTLGSAIVLVVPITAIRTAPVPWVTEVFEAARDVTEETVWQVVPKVMDRSHVAPGAQSVSIAVRDLLGITWVLGTLVSLICLLRDGWKLHRHLRGLRRLSDDCESTLAVPDIDCDHLHSRPPERMPHAVILVDPGASSPYSCGWWWRMVVAGGSAARVVAQ